MGRVLSKCAGRKEIRVLMKWEPVKDISEKVEKQ